MFNTNPFSEISAMISRMYGSVISLAAASAAGLPPVASTMTCENSAVSAAGAGGSSAEHPSKSAANGNRYLGVTLIPSAAEQLGQKVLCCGP